MIPHEVWTGADFSSSPVARFSWWTLYGAALGAVLVYRVGLPLYRTLRHRLVVSAVVPQGPGVVSVSIRGRLTTAARTRRTVTLLAGGMGITPMRALLEDLPDAPGDATLVYRARTEQDLVLRRELDALAQARGGSIESLQSALDKARL